MCLTPGSKILDQWWTPKAFNSVTACSDLCNALTAGQGGQTSPSRCAMARKMLPNSLYVSCLSLSVMAGRVPATRALAGVPRPWRPHRLGVDGRDTPGHDGL